MPPEIERPVDLDLSLNARPTITDQPPPVPNQGPAIVDLVQADPPDLRTLAAEALARSAGSPAFAPQVANDPHWNRPRHELQADADAVLAAVLPAHRELVLTEAAQMILTHIDEHFPADGNDVQRRARRILRIAVQVVSPTPTREQLAEKLVEMGILELAATTPPTRPSEPQTAQNGPAVEREGPGAQGGAEACRKCQLPLTPCITCGKPAQCGDSWCTDCAPGDEQAEVGVTPATFPRVTRESGR